MADETTVNGVVGDPTVDIHKSNETDVKPALLMDKIAGLEEEKLHLLQENEWIKENVNKLQQETQILETNIAEMKREMNEFQADKKALESIAARAAQLESEVSRLQHDLITSMNEGQEANSELSSLKSEFLELQNRESEKNLRIDSVQKERDLLMEKIASLENKESNYEKERILSEEDYRRIINEKDSEIVALKTLVGKLENMVKGDRVELERGKKEREELDIVKNELEALLKKSERKVKEMEHKVGGLETEKVIYGLKNNESLNGKGGTVSRDVLEEREKGQMSLKVQWPKVLCSVGTVAAVVILCFRYARKK